VLGSGRSLFLIERTEKTPKNFRQLFSVIAETDIGHRLVCYRIPFCIVSLHKQLHIYNCYDYDCNRYFLHHEWLLIFVVEVTELEIYQVLFCF